MQKKEGQATGPSQAKVMESLKVMWPALCCLCCLWCALMVCPNGVQRAESQLMAVKKEKAQMSVELQENKAELAEKDAQLQACKLVAATSAPSAGGDKAQIESLSMQVRRLV